MVLAVLSFLFSMVLHTRRRLLASSPFLLLVSAVVPQDWSVLACHGNMAAEWIAEGTKRNAFMISSYWSQQKFTFGSRRKAIHTMN